MEQFDVVVIGSGPAGEGAAMTAAKHHKSVAVVERYYEVGGGCTHWGTIPSKALRHAAKILHDVRRNPLLREFSDASRLTYPQLLASANKVIETQVASRHRFYERNRVPLFSGEASFVDPHTLEVQPANGKPVRVAGQHIVIAAGSRPYHPPEVDFTHERICDSDTILRYGQHPFSVTIYGAGVIGCEYASIFVNLGVKVTLVNTQDRLLSFLDDEIAEALSYHLREQGCVIRHNEQFKALEARERDVVLHLESGRKIKSDVLLWANGRTGNAKQLKLENAGLTSNERGQIAVNRQYQTAVPHIYAVGDIVGPPALASAAYVQGSHAVEHILDPEGSAAPAGDDPERHLHDPGDFLDRPQRARAAGSEGAVRGRPLRVQEPGARADDRRARRHAEDHFPRGDHGGARRALLRRRRFRDRAHRPDRDGQRGHQRHPLFHRHDVQLSDDGGGVSCRRLQRHQPTDLT